LRERLVLLLGTEHKPSEPEQPGRVEPAGLLRSHLRALPSPPHTVVKAGGDGVDLRAAARASPGWSPVEALPARARIGTHSTVPGVPDSVRLNDEPERPHGWHFDQNQVNGDNDEGQFGACHVSYWTPPNWEDRIPRRCSAWSLDGVATLRAFLAAWPCDLTRAQLWVAELLARPARPERAQGMRFPDWLEAVEIVRGQLVVLTSQQRALCDVHMELHEHTLDSAFELAQLTLPSRNP
jgi:hypothetical protein